MKKIFLTLGLALILFLNSHAIKLIETIGVVIDLNSLTNDTALYSWGGREFKCEDYSLMVIEVDYSGVSTSDATFGVGVSLFGNTYNVVASDMPYILDYDTDTIDIPSFRPTQNKASKMWTISNVPADNLCMWFTKGTESSTSIVKVRIKLYKEGDE